MSSVDRKLPVEEPDSSSHRLTPRRLGAAGISFGLPILIYAFIFGCNDISGCPAPSLLHPKSLDLETLKREVGWPEEGVAGLYSNSVMGYVLAYYLVNLLLHAFLPASVVEGTELASGGRLKYRFNGMSVTSPCRKSCTNSRQPSHRT